MIIRWLGIFCLCTVLLTACQNQDTQDMSEENVDQNELEKIDVKQWVDETENDAFTFHVEATKPSYDTSEVVVLEAEITNKSDDTITMTHSSSAVYFNMEEKTRAYTIPYAVNDIGVTTELAPGESIVESYEKSGGFSEENDDAYQVFMEAFLEDDGFPAGYYVVHAETDFYVKETDEHVNLEATIDFLVKDE